MIRNTHFIISTKEIDTGIYFRGKKLVYIYLWRRLQCWLLNDIESSIKGDNMSFALQIKCSPRGLAPFNIQLIDMFPRSLWSRHDETTATQITGISIVYSTVSSGADKKKSKLRVTGLCEGNSPVTREFPSLRASNAENVFISWRHHDNAQVWHT